MKRLIIFGLIWTAFAAPAQERWEYDDFTDGKKVTVDNITYVIDNKLQDMAGSIATAMSSDGPKQSCAMFAFDVLTNLQYNSRDSENIQMGHFATIPKRAPESFVTGRRSL